MANTKIPSELIDGTLGVAGISSSADATAITIDSSERVSVGHTTANADFQVSNAGAEQLEFYAGNASDVNTIQHYNRSSSSYVENRQIANNHTWYNGGSAVANINTKGIFYGNESGVVYDGLVGHYEMLEAASYSGSGSTWTNLAGSSNNGTFYNYTYAYKDHMRGTDGNYLQVKWDNPLNNTSNNTICILFATNDKTSVTFGNGAAGSNYIGAWEDTGTQNFYNGNAGTVTPYINGEQTSAWTNRRERGACRWHWVEFKNVDFTAAGWSELWFNKYAASYQMANYNTCIGAVLFYNKNLTDAERQQNYMFMRRRYGETPDFRTQIVYPTLTSPWTNYGGTWQSVHYYKDTHGVVHVAGLASANGTSAGGTIFQLPIGFRPKELQMHDGSRDGAEGAMMWNIYADGTVGPRVTQSSWASLGFSFLAAGQ